MTRRVRWSVAGTLAVAMGAAGVGAFAPVAAGPREVLYVIPAGTAQRRAAGQDPAVFPARLHFIIGVRDVLVLRNDDEVPASFGPVLLAPGQTYRLPFRAPMEVQLACSVHAGDAIGIEVTAEPAPGWARLRWRLDNLLRGRG